MPKENKKPIPLTKKDFFNIEECNCGKTPFRYHNTSKNEFIVKCNTPTDEYDLKLKKWVKCKRQPCDFFYVYYAERPVFEEIKTTLIKRANLYFDKNKVLEEKLKLLFQFLMVSNHTSTLDEINILVKNNLKREPRKTYYSPSLSYFMPVVGYESFEDYRERVFSQRIIDLDLYEPVTPKHDPVVFVTSPFLERTVNKPVTKKHKLPKTKPVKIVTSSNFIIVSDDDTSSEEADDQSDNDSETSRELSDYEDNASVVEEEVYEEENYDDYDDAGGEDYDD